MGIADNFSSLDRNIEGVRVIASAPINVIVYYLKTEQGKRELAERAADIHAEISILKNKIVHQIKRWNYWMRSLHPQKKEAREQA